MWGDARMAIHASGGANPARAGRGKPTHIVAGIRSNAGLKEGDIIVAIDGQDVADAEGVGAAIADLEPGSRIDVDIVRDGEAEQVTVVLGVRNDVIL